MYLYDRIDKSTVTLLMLLVFLSPMTYFNHFNILSVGTIKLKQVYYR